MHLGDTIVAHASPPGRSARALVRVSGPAVRDILHERVTLSSRAPDRSAPRCGDAIVRIEPDPRVARAEPQSGHTPRTHVAIPALALVWSGPRSFTGEDSLELILPGNPALIDRVIEALCAVPSAQPIRRALPGEFSARAFLRGRITLDQAESIACMIGASGEAELRAAQRFADAPANAQRIDWTDRVATLLALVEAGVDFSDQEDVVAIEHADLASRADALAREIDRALGPERTALHNPHLPTVALAGTPNAGKSTLMNALLGRTRAVVSDVRGTTRDALSEPIDLSRFLPGAADALLVDLAGIENRIQTRIDAEAQTQAQRALAHADLILWCDPEGAFDHPALLALTNGRDTIRVRTMADRAGPPSALAEIAVCAIDRWNIHALGALVALRLTLAPTAGSSGIVVVARHRAALGAARAELRRVADLAQRNAEHATSHADPAVLAAHLRAALDALGEITGALPPDEILGRVFSRFCVGK